MRLFFLLFIFITIQSFPIDKDKFNSIMELINESRLDEAQIEIDKFSSDQQKDGDYYVLVINYYFQKARHSGVTINTNVPDKSDSLYLEMKYSLDSTKTAYMSDTVYYDMDILLEGINKFKPALDKFPDRLDILYGLVYISKESGQNKQLGETLIRILNRSGENKNHWLWSFNEKLEDGYSFMIENLQSYLVSLIEKGDETSMELLYSISGKMIELYPDNIYGYNNMAYYYHCKNQLPEAHKYFLLAEKVDPKDIIVLANLAKISLDENNIPDAEAYYNKIIEYGNEDDKKWAEDKIKQLKN
jgi:tetratricopeptide (TPR) repeat protein